MSGERRGKLDALSIEGDGQVCLPPVQDLGLPDDALLRFEYRNRPFIDLVRRSRK